MNTRRILVLILCFSLLVAVVSASSADEIIIELTEEEKAFIEEHPIISLGVDPTFIPFEFVDIDGQYKGIARDYIDLLSKRIGIQMVIAENLTWSEAYELAVEKKIDEIISRCPKEEIGWSDKVLNTILKQQEEKNKQAFQLIVVVFMYALKLTYI